MGHAGEQEVGICTRICTSAPLLQPGVMTLLVRVFEDRDIDLQPFLIRIFVGLSALRDVCSRLLSETVSGTGVCRTGTAGR